MATPCAYIIRLCATKTKKARLMGAVLFTVALLLVALSQDASSAIYRYTDKDGVISFTDDPKRVPPEYRNKVTVIEETPLQTSPARPITNPAQPIDSASQEGAQMPPPPTPAEDKGNAGVPFGLTNGDKPNLPLRVIIGVAVSAVLFIALRRLFASLGLKRLGALIWVAVTCLVFVYLMSQQLKKSAEYISATKNETDLMKKKLEQKEQDALKALEEAGTQK